jgi:hypothetical protein
MLKISYALTSMVEELLAKARSQRDQACADKAICELKVIKTTADFADVKRLGEFTGKLSVFEWVIPALNRLAEILPREDTFLDDARLFQSDHADLSPIDVEGLRNQVRRLNGIDEGLHAVTAYLEKILDYMNDINDAKSECLGVLRDGEIVIDSNGETFV